MTRKYTQQINVIAKNAGMFDFTKKPFVFSTYRLVVNSLSRICSYFEDNKFPIRLIFGDPKTIECLVQFCPAIADIPAFPTKEIKNLDITEYRNCTILIAQESFFDTVRFETEVYNISPACKVCSLYEYLEWNHINIRLPFWSIKKSTLLEKGKFAFHYMLSYEWFNCIINPFYYKIKKNTHLSPYRFNFINREMVFCAYRTLTSGFLSSEEKKIQYKKFMGYSVLEKDIIGLKKYIQEYSDCYDQDYKKYIDQIEQLILSMKNRIAARQSKDILLHWVDSISNKRLASEMPFLYHLSQAENSIKSEYAYTVMPWTTVAMKTILTGKKPIEGKLYQLDILPEDIALFQTLRKHGYDFRYYGSVYGQMKIFSRKHKGMTMNSMNTYVSTEYLWDALDDLAYKKDAPAFLLIHTLCETHVPYFCPESKHLLEKVYLDEDKHFASAWMDQQYEFYMDLLGQKPVQIFMGDHGEHDKYKYDYLDGKVHVAFFVNNPIQKFDFSKGMFSLVNFVALLNVIMGWEDPVSANPLTECVITESYDYYGRGKINEVIDSGDKALLLDKGAWMQHKSIRNREYEYVRYFDGEEFLFDLCDENTNLIGDGEYRELLEKFRSELGTEFVDIYQENCFALTRKLYEAYRNVKQVESCHSDGKTEGDMK